MSKTVSPTTEGCIYDALSTTLLEDDSTPLYYLHDPLAFPQVIANGSGGVVETYTYDPYGNLLGSTGSDPNRLGFASGDNTDAETGFLYLVTRIYEPANVQFLSVDPDLAETGQPYAFTGDDPLNATDPLGLAPTFAQVIANPSLIKGWSPNRILKAFGKTKGLRLSRLSRGSAKGQGLKLNEENDEGTDVTDRSISYHPPAVGHHVEEFPEGYYKVSSGNGGTVRLPASRPTGALPIPGDNTDGFGHTLPSNFNPSTTYDPLNDDPPVPTTGFWGMLRDGFFGGGDDDG